LTRVADHHRGGSARAYHGGRAAHDEPAQRLPRIPHAPERDTGHHSSKRNRNTLARRYLCAPMLEAVLVLAAAVADVFRPRWSLVCSWS
jgi:hypothetical protein